MDYLFHLWPIKEIKKKHLFKLDKKITEVVGLKCQFDILSTFIIIHGNESTIIKIIFRYKRGRFRVDKLKTTISDRYFC